MRVKRAKVLTERNAGEAAENFRKSARGLRVGSGGLDLARGRPRFLVLVRIVARLARPDCRDITRLLLVHHEPAWRENASPVHPYSRVGVAGSLISGFSRI